MSTARSTASSPAGAPPGPDATFPVYLVRGDDSVLVSEASRHLVAGLVGPCDPNLVVEEVPTEHEIRSVIDAAQTPPFFGDRRVVVARDVGRFLTAEVAPLLAYLADPLPSTRLVLVAGGGQVPRSLVDAVRKLGHVVDAAVPSGRNRGAWLATRLRQAPVKLDAAATKMLGDHLGEDVGRITSLLDMLAASYGDGARIGTEHLSPFLGDPGSVAPWDLTDAIDRGDTAGAINVLHRLLGAGARHPLVLMATLHTHFSRMLALDGSGAHDEAAAAAVLGITGSTYPAKKALLGTRKLGSEGVARAIQLLAAADLDLKGASAAPGTLVLEVLVARLSRLGSNR